MRRIRPSATRTPRASYTDWSEMAPISALTASATRVGRDVGLTRDRPQDRQSLGRDLNAALTKEISRVGGHAGHPIK